MGVKMTENLLEPIPYGRQSIDESDIGAVIDVLRSPSLTQGPKILEFEQAIADYVGAKYCVAVTSATAGLHVACLATDINSSEEIITSPNTFLSSVNCGVFSGARPCFVDIDSRTYNMDETKLTKALTFKTRVLVPVHFAGQPCNMKAIHQTVDEFQNKIGKKVYIIEDAAHALGSLYDGKKVGDCRHSDMCVFSFHPVKHITTAEGGAITTNDHDLYERLLLFRNHGMTRDPGLIRSQTSDPWYYEQHVLGYNYRITDVQCALGLSQLKRIDEFKSRRREIINRYNDAFRDTPALTVPFEADYADSNFHLYVLLVDFESIGVSRAVFMQTLKRHGISTQVHYIPVHTQPYYRKKFDFSWGDFPISEEYYNKTITLPLHPNLSDDDVQTIIIHTLELVEKK